MVWVSEAESFSGDLGLRALRAVAAAPRAGPASSDLRLLRPAWTKPVE